MADFTFSPGTGTTITIPDEGIIMHQFDPSLYMLGTAVTLVIGIAIGAAIVAICWYCAGWGPIRRDEARAANQKKEWEAALLKEATEDIQIRRSQQTAAANRQ